MRIFESLVEFLSWLKIVASPTIVGLTIGFVFCLYKPDIVGIIIGGFITLIGLVIGIMFANHISKKVGAAEFNSELNATRDLDKLEENK